jgi:hypothetical protein
MNASTRRIPRGKVSRRLSFCGDGAVRRNRPVGGSPAPARVGSPSDEGPYRAVGPSPVQLLAARFRPSQATRCKLASLRARSTLCQRGGRGFESRLVLQVLSQARPPACESSAPGAKTPQRRPPEGFAASGGGLPHSRIRVGVSGCSPPRSRSRAAPTPLVHRTERVAGATAAAARAAGARSSTSPRRPGAARRRPGTRTGAAAASARSRAATGSDPANPPTRRDEWRDTRPLLHRWSRRRSARRSASRVRTASACPSPGPSSPQRTRR